MIGSILGGRYEILEQIGGGGMANVYKAKCRLLNRYVAIKILKDEFSQDQEFVEKFRRESQAAASLSHPNIVNIYDVGTENKGDSTIHYIVMEYIKGITLKDKIRKQGKISVDKSLEYVLQLASAIKDAHDNGIIHRDIKPQNIMIDENNRVKVMDFGIARAATSATISTSSETLGSVHYFSPEQARGGYTDEKSDIYSIGIVMYEMLTGDLPYTGESPITVALKHVQEEIKKPSLTNPNIPFELESIILKCVEKKQINRYRNIDELIKDLKKVNLKENQNFKKDEENFEDSYTRVLPTIDKNIKEKNSNLKSKNKSNKDNKSSRRAVILGVFLAFILTSSIFFGKNFISNFTLSNEVVMPNLINETEESAKEILKELGLNLKVKKIQKDGIKPGLVISQNEEPGTKLKKGYPVEIGVSESKGNTKVPNLIGMSISEAEGILRRLSLVFDVEYTPSDTVELDKIISQSIPEGTEVEKGTVIKAQVSQGKENVEVVMPKVIGNKLEDGEAILISNKLKLGSVREEESDAPKGVIIWQSHVTGDKLEENTLINLKISNGRPPKIEENNTQPEENDNRENPIQLTINVANDQTEIRVIRTQNGIQDTIHNQIENTGDVIISTSGVPGVKFDIYANGTLIDTVTK